MSELTPPSEKEQADDLIKALTGDIAFIKQLAKENTLPFEQAAAVYSNTIRKSQTMHLFLLINEVQKTLDGIRASLKLKKMLS